MKKNSFWTNTDGIVWYDLETSGISKAFDQPLQFAAITTTPDLDEVETINISIKLTADIVPSPDALLVHRIPITPSSSAIGQDIAIERIHQIINQPNTTNGGYNTLKFDDEFLRFCFFRHLYHPYTHQFSNGCKRFDLYPTVIYYYLFSNSTLTWPQIHQRPSFKLENLAKANLKESLGHAHDALVDVKMTIDLAKIMMSDQECWHDVTQLFDKNHDLSQTNLLPLVDIDNKTYCHGLLVDTSLGHQRDFSSLCLSIGSHDYYKNQSLWLSMDKQLLSDFDNIEDMYQVVIKKKWGEPPFLLHPDKVQQISSQDEKKRLFESNLLWLQQNPDKLFEISQTFKQRTYVSQDNTDLDAKLYEIPFFSTQEEEICDQFHTSPPNAKASLVERLDHPVLKEQAIRYLWRYHPEALASIKHELSSSYQNQMQQIHNKPILDHTGKEKLTPQACLERIEAIIQEKDLSEEDKSLIKELEIYIYDHFMSPFE